MRQIGREPPACARALARRAAWHAACSGLAAMARHRSYGVFVLALGVSGLALALAVAGGCAALDEGPGDGRDDTFLTGKADGLAITSAETAAVLEVVNTASEEELDLDAALDARAARNIARHRDGADGLPGTGDDDRFDDLAELDAIPYVGPVALERLVAYARALGLVGEDGGEGGGEDDGTCLVISEYLEGQGNYNKAIELLNCGGAPVDLDAVHICLVRNDDTTCTTSQALAGSLAPGRVLTLCRRFEETFLDPMPLITEHCQVEAPGVMSFSGNDRLVVFRDADGGGELDAGDQVLDAFGHIAVAPSFELWADMVLRRCRLEPFDGSRFFPYLEYFTRHTRHDHSDYGIAPPPDTTCP